jgi:hypothetical protein
MQNVFEELVKIKFFGIKIKHVWMAYSWLNLSVFCRHMTSIFIKINKYTQWSILSEDENSLYIILGFKSLFFNNVCFIMCKCTCTIIDI